MHKTNTNVEIIRENQIKSLCSERINFLRNQLNNIKKMLQKCHNTNNGNGTNNLNEAIPMDIDIFDEFDNYQTIKINCKSEIEKIQKELYNMKKLLLVCKENNEFAKRKEQPYSKYINTIRGPRFVVGDEPESVLKKIKRSK